MVEGFQRKRIPGYEIVLSISECSYVFWFLIKLVLFIKHFRILG